MKFEPTKESISQHKVPEWYDDAKFGIFIHWSLSSVPAFAPTVGQSLHELAEEDKGFSHSMKNSPYAEWYLNTMRIDGSPTQKHHEETFGSDYSYLNFQKTFEERNVKMDPNEWAEFFKEAGAKYVVLVTKHHDGYCLWPSEYKNPKYPEYQSTRDLVGEITDAVRAKGMKMGLYYSGIFDWTFKDYPIDSIENWVKHQLVTDEYCEYATNHMLELIEKYKPSILWNDIGYPANYDLNELLATYYNTVPEGVINDRWKQIRVSDENSEEEIKEIAEELEKSMVEKGISGLFATDNHIDFVTPEYASFDKAQEQKWEATRGMGMSFGFNQVEGEADMLTASEVIYMLIDTVSKNGNLLINVGPMSDGTIPEMQKKPLLETGKWLKTNGEAIYSTRPWKKAMATTEDGKEVRYTQNGDTLYAIIMNEDVKGNVTIKDLELEKDAKISLLGNDSELNWTQGNGNVTVNLPANIEKQYAYTLKIQ